MELLWSERFPAHRSKLIHKLHWAGNVYITLNFLSSTSGAGAEAAHVRMADNILLFKDGTILLISERETEYILRALPEVPAANVKVCLVNLAMHRWAAASSIQTWSDVPLAVGPLSGLFHHQMSIATGLVCVQLFNGETEFLHGSTAQGTTQAEPHASCKEGGDAIRRSVLLATIFGKHGERSGAGLGRNAAEALVQLRGRHKCWPDSQLELICTRQVTQAQFQEARQGVEGKMKKRPAIILGKTLTFRKIKSYKCKK